MKDKVETIRAQFPALALRDQGQTRVYLDNPAGTQVPQAVIDRMADCLLQSNANIGGSFRTSKRADAVVAEARLAAAEFLNSPSPEQVVFGQNMTSLTFHISRSIGRHLHSGDEIILSRMDHDANVEPWQLLARDQGLNIRWLPFDSESFEFELSALQNLLSQKTKLICVCAASNLTGTINDVRAISRMAREVGAWSYIDAVHYAPHVATDVQDLGCDFYVCSAYKFFGPHQGILWGRKDALEALEPCKVRPAPEHPPGCFETGTQSHESMAGTTAAVDYLAWIGATMAEDKHRVGPTSSAGRRHHVQAGMNCLAEYETILARHLIDGLQRLPGIKVQGITANEALPRRVPTVSFTAWELDPSRIAAELAKQNIFVWSGHNYAVETVRALGLDGSGGVVRIGAVHYNTMEELDRLLEALEKILTKQHEK